MSSQDSQQALLEEVLERVTESNLKMRPGTPMAELRAAIESALASLEPLEFEEFSEAIGNTEAAENLVRRAPEIIGWNADQIVEWVEGISKKIS